MVRKESNQTNKYTRLFVKVSTCYNIFEGWPWAGLHLLTLTCIQLCYFYGARQIITLRSGRVGRGFEPHWVVYLSKNINPSLVLVQPRKTRPFITERLLMGRKESNQTNKPHAFTHLGKIFYPGETKQLPILNFHTANNLIISHHCL